MKNFSKPLALFITWCCCTAPACAQDSSVEAHAAVLPYLTDDVAAVVYLDVPSVNLPALVQEARAYGVPDALLSELVANANDGQVFFDRLTDLGARRAYMLVRPADIAHQGFACVLETADDRPREELVNLLGGIFEMDRASTANDAWFVMQRLEAVDGGVLMAMNDEQLDQVKGETTESPRADVIDALTALGDGDAGVILFGDADSRRVIREMFPQLPAPFMEIDGRLIADGLQWGGLKVKHPPEPQATLVIEAASDDVAETVQQSIVKGLELAKAAALASLSNPDVRLPIDPVVVAQSLALLKPEADGQRLSLRLGDDENELAFVRDLLAPAVKAAQQSSVRQTRVNQFKLIALAMHNYASAHETNNKEEGRRSGFPAHANYDEQGRPLLSWRVHMLPYLEQGELYNKFHLDEPWDSEHNLKLVNEMPDSYADPDPVLRASIGEGRTTFVVPYGEETVFHGQVGTAFRDITDGTVNTILCIEVIPQQAVVWTKPDDWEANLEQPLAGVRRTDRDDFVAAYCDGSVHVLANSIDAAKFRALLTKAGDDVSFDD